MLLRLALALVVAGVVSGCSGQSCDGLAGMQAERDRLRAAYTDLASGGTAPADEVDAAHDELHAYEKRVYDVEQECDR